MKSFDVVGYAYGDDLFCTDCWRGGIEDIDSQDELVEDYTNVIFADSKFAWQPSCSECNEPLKINVIQPVDMIKCPECGKSVPGVTKEADYNELLCNECYERFEEG